MKVTVQLVIELENDNTSQIFNVGEWQRDEPFQPLNLGLALAESKQLLKNIQRPSSYVEARLWVLFGKSRI